MALKTYQQAIEGKLPITLFNEVFSDKIKAYDPKRQNDISVNPLLDEVKRIYNDIKSRYDEYKANKPTIEGNRNDKIEMRTKPESVQLVRDKSGRIIDQRTIPAQYETKTKAEICAERTNSWKINIRSYKGLCKKLEQLINDSSMQSWEHVKEVFKEISESLLYYYFPRGYKIDSDSIYDKIDVALKGFMFEEGEEQKEAQNPFFIDDPVRRGKLIKGKENIMEYINISNKSFKTFERYRKEENLPVRQNNGSKGRLYAFKGELDLWLTNHNKN